MSEDWTLVPTTLGELCAAGGGDVQTGPFGSQLHASDYVSDGIPSVMPQNIGDNVISDEGIARISTTDAARLSKYLLRSDDIVYSRRGDIEKRALVRTAQDGWLCGTGCLRVRFGDNPSCDPRFISYLLGTSESRDWIARHAVGATMPNLNTSILAALPLAVPDSRRQRAIAEVLGALDDKIAANAKLAATTDEYLAARFVEFAAGDHGLEPVALSDIAAVNGAVAKPVSGRQLRYVDIASVGVGEFNFPELSDWDSAPSRARRRIRRGDTIWSTVRPNRRSHALNLSDDPDLVGSTGLAVLTPTHVGFAYLYELTKTDEFVSHLENSAEGSAYPAVRADRFEVALVPLLGQSRREKFEAVAAPMRVRQHMAAMESDVLAKLRDTLLPPLMSGKLRVRDAEKQVEGAV